MQELESKIAIAQQEVLGLHNHIHATEVQIKKTLQGKERELYQLQMDLIMVKQRKAILEQQMQSFETIKGKRDLLKANQEREDAKY